MEINWPIDERLVWYVHEANVAGLDLEMSGGTRFRGPAVRHAITANKVKHSPGWIRIRW